MTLDLIEILFDPGIADRAKLTDSRISLELEAHHDHFRELWPLSRLSLFAIDYHVIHCFADLLTHS